MLLFCTFVKFTEKEALEMTEECLRRMGNETTLISLDKSYFTKCKRFFMTITNDSKVPRAVTTYTKNSGTQRKHVNYQRVTPNSTCRPGSVTCQENRCFVMRRESGEFTGEALCPLCGKNIHKHSRRVVCPNCLQGIKK